MSKFLRYARAYIIPFSILLLLFSIDIIFSPESDFVKGLFTDQVIVSFDENDPVEEAGPEDESEEDTESEYHADSLPDRFRHRNDSAWTLFRSKNYTAAETIWRTLRDSTQQNLYFSRLIGIALYYQKEYLRAEELFLTLLEDNPDDVKSAYNAARSAYRLNHNRNALRMVDSALSLDSLYNRACYLKGSILEDLRQYLPAEAWYRTALDRGYNKSRSWRALAELLAKTDRKEEALHAAHQAIRFNPQAIRPRRTLARLYGETDSLSAARKTYTDILAIRPADYSARLNLVDLFLEEKDFQAATRHLAILKDYHPDDIDVLYAEAKLCGLQGEEARALELYETIAARDRSNPRVYYNKAINLMDAGKIERALASYKKALEINPYYWKASYNLGVHYLKNNRPEKALHYFRRTSENNREHISTWYNMGLIHLRANRFSQAAETFRRVISLDSTKTNARYNLALALMSREEYEEARNQLNQLLEMDRENEKVDFNLGLIALRQNRYTEAVSWFESAASKTEGYYIAYFNIALAYERMPDYPKALQTIDRVLLRRREYPKALLKKGELLTQIDTGRSVFDTLIHTMDSLSLTTQQKRDYAALLYTAGRYTRVEQLLGSFSKKERSDETDILYGRTLVQQKKYARAAEVFSEVSNDMDDDHAALADYARTLHAVGEINSAIKTIHRAIDIRPENRDYRCLLADIVYEQKNWADAASEYSRVRNLGDSGTQVLENLAYALLKTDTYERSYECYRTLLSRDNTDWSYLYYSALLARRNNRLETSIRLWKKFAREYSDDYRAFYQLGKTYIRLNRYEAAVEALEKSLERNRENNSRSLYYLAKAWIGRGNRQGGLRYAQQYETAHPNSARGEELRKKISEMR
ncbi:MAG: tetratricopeptide repeat protein [Fibrobacterota bacterium]